MSKTSIGAGLLVSFGMAAALSLAVTNAGADVSWVPLQGVSRTAVYVNTSSSELLPLREELLRVAESVLRERGFHAPADGGPGLHVLVDLYDVGDDCGKRVVVVTTTRFEDVIIVPRIPNIDSNSYIVDTWRREDVTVVERSSLQDVVKGKVLEGVRLFAESLAKAKAISKRSG